MTDLTLELTEAFNRHNTLEKIEPCKEGEEE